MIKQYLKYNSSSKEFIPIGVSGFTTTTDAVVLYPAFYN